MTSSAKSDKKSTALRYGLYFLIPLLTMLAIFIIQQMFPFGKHTLLTYDLNEQYVDFYAFYRDTLLHHPSQFFYSFTNGLGGETVGLWAYYLLSPFNLILLLTPGKWLPVGIMIMTLVKFSFAGYAICYFLDHVFPSKRTRMFLPMVAVVYPLMGWTLANQFNVMWLDVLILMPFILYGIEKLIDTDHLLYFAIFVGLTLLINFYMGYMVCVFACLYFIWTAVRKWNGWRSFGKRAGKFAFGGILGAASVGFLLFPAYYDIVHSKGQYMMQSLPVKIEYAPWKMLSKFVMGALNDNQVQNGLPNLFIGSAIVIGFILYFLAKKIPWREKLAAGLVTLFLAASLCWSPLDLFWHLFQYPVFYPYRFSFVVGIWMVILAVRGIVQIGKPNWLQLTVAAFLPLSCLMIMALNLQKFNFLNTAKIIGTTVFFCLIMIALSIALLTPLKTKKQSTVKLIAVLAVTILSIIEMGANAQLTMKVFQWTSEKDYAAFTSSLDNNVAWIQKHAAKNEFYRIGKTYQRTENDSLQAGYNGISNFSSTQRANVTHLMRELGQPTFTGKVNYTKGTPLTDALFDLQYFLSPVNQYNNLTGSNVTPASSYRPDISYYTPVHKRGDVATYSNPLAMGLGFAANRKVLQPLSMSPTDTTANQDAVLNAITGKNQQFFNKVGYSIEAVNCHLEGGANGILVTDDKQQPSSYTIIIKNTNNLPYYLQMDSNILWNANITVNGNSLPGVGNIYQPALVNVAANIANTTVKIQINPTNGKDVALNNFYVYQLNLDKLQKAVYKVKENQMNLLHLGKLKLTGTVNIPSSQDILMTTIPYSKGWHVKVDGEKVKSQKALGAFLAVPMSPGKHLVKFSFWPPLLNLGIIVSLFAWTMIYLIFKKEY